MSYYDVGHAAVLLTRSGEKMAADVAAALSYGLKGKLYKSQSGWLLLTVPNALARGCFDALGELGAELPPSKGSAFNAHISVVRPEELATIKGEVTERGHDFSYTLGPVREVEPAGWPEMSKVWFIEVRSPELEKLRKSYGLTALPDGDKKPFHITFAVRRRAVLHDNEKSVGRITKLTHLIHKPSRLFDDQYGQKVAALKPGVTLQPHQEEIAETGNTDEQRMLLYHSLGSGKTLSGISAAETAGDPYTAVTPASLRPNFTGEQAKFTDGTVPSNVTSYNALAKGSVPPTDTLLFDEAHRLRNPNTKGTAEATRLAEQAKHVYLLSGSPIVNRPSDLASLITILTGQKMTPEEFDAKFVDEQKVSPGLLGWLNGVKPGTQPAIKNRQEFHDLLKGHVSYYAPSKPGVDKMEESFHVPMSNQQQSLYQAFWDQLPFLLRWKLQRDFPLTREEINNLSSFLSGPRQVGLSTLPFMKGRQDPMLAFNQSPKLQKAFENLQAMRQADPNTRAIIFSNFIDAGLKPYAAALAKNKIPHAIFHGGLNDAERKRIVGEFNTGKLPVMLLGPSGGEGISLRHAKLMQILDPHWNETRNQQAIGRGVRFDSHSDLPVDQRNIKVQRYFSQLPSGMWQRIWRKFVNRKPDNEINNPGTDLYLARMADKKEEFNDVFRHELQQIGSEKAAGQVYEIRKSAIHGKGCFATKSFEPGDVIGKALHKMPDQLQTYDETMLGRFINHADEDNTTLRDDGDGTYSLVASRAIASGEELTANYRDADEMLGPGHTYTYEGKPLQIAEDDPTEEKTAGLRNDLLKEIERARGETDTNPTEEQKKAGNYTKGKFSLHGLQISLENPKGSTRSGKDKSGKAWSITMAHDYGYIRGTLSDADEDHVDCFIGPNPESHMVFIIDQNDPATGKFDEHKVIFGASTKAEAEAVYLSCYDKDWKGLAGTKSMHLYEFKRWLKTGDTGKPSVGQVVEKAAESRPEAVVAGAAPSAEPSVLPLLQQAKAESDKRNFARKAQILRGLMQQVPAEWQVDSPTGREHGITHLPTRFKFHLPPKAIPATVKKAVAPTALRAVLQPRGGTDVSHLAAHSALLVTGTR